MHENTSAAPKIRKDSTVTQESINVLQSQKLSIDDLDESNIPQAFCLRWNNYQTNLMTSFSKLLQDEQFVDVTLSGEGFSIKAHKMVLSACSPYFEKVFHENPCKHPIVILRDVRWPELKSVVEFMYKGEINVSQDEIEPLLRLAQVLKVRGLADVNTDSKVHFDSSNTATATTATSTTTTTTTIATTPTTTTNTTPITDTDKKYFNNNVNCDEENTTSQKRPRLSSKEWDDCILDFINSKGVSKFKNVTDGEVQMVNVDADVQIPNLNSLIEDSCSSSLKPQVAVDESTTDLVIDENNSNTIGQTWLGTASTSSSMKEFYDPTQAFKLLNSKKSYAHFLKLKPPTWTQIQLRDAINAVVTQKLRFTQASVRYNIPKGTLYDNILGKSNRMQVLDEAGIDSADEKIILEFCCDSSFPPYNRRTKKPLHEIIAFVQNMCKLPNNPFKANSKFCFRWWWAFCKKYSIVSLHYDMNIKTKQKNTRSRTK